MMSPLRYLSVFCVIAASSYTFTKVVLDGISKRITVLERKKERQPETRLIVRIPQQNMITVKEAMYRVGGIHGFYHSRKKGEKGENIFL